MQTFVKFLAPLVLGVIAFALIFASVAPQLGQDFVTVSNSVGIDEILSEGHLRRFKLVGDDFSRISQTLIPWSERAAVLGLPVRRAMDPGDFVFWQDLRYVTPDFSLAEGEIPLHVSLDGVDYEPSLLKLGNLIGLIVPVAASDDKGASPPAAGLKANFEELGPFRILSVGQRTLASPNEVPTGGAHGNVHMVTLACRLDPVSSSGHKNARIVPEAARKLLAAKSMRRQDGKNVVAMVLYQNATRIHP